MALVRWMGGLTRDLGVYLDVFQVYLGGFQTFFVMFTPKPWVSMILFDEPAYVSLMGWSPMVKLGGLGVWWFGIRIEVPLSNNP